MSRMVTGRPSIASRISPKSPRCSRSIASSASLRADSSSASTRSSTSCRRSPRNMCSVRHRPMPEAPNRLARAASSGVSAFARTSSRRTASAWVSSAETASTTGSSHVGALEVTDDGGVHDGDLAGVDLTGGPVEGDGVSLPEDATVLEADLSAGKVDDQVVGPTHARATHAPRHDGCVRGLATPAGQGAPGSDHPGQVVGVGLLPDEDDGFSPTRPRHRGGGVEHHPADGSTGGGVDADREEVARCARIEAGKHQEGQLVTGDTREGLVAG